MWFDELDYGKEYINIIIFIKNKHGYNNYKSACK